MTTEHQEIVRVWRTLTPMQRSVLMLCRELPDKLIADRLRISTRGVRYHQGRLRAAFGCDSKIALAVMGERVSWSVTSDTMTKTAN
jgi:DNA-binding CsgD family transcriptional regulator